ncbi:MAG: recombination mediator RecR [Alkalispirochaetaceae bacterium]
MNALDELIDSLSRLPGVGKKSATRLAYHLLGTEESFNQKLAEQIGRIKERIVSCSICGNYTEEDPCEICRDGGRDRRVICVVEQPQDVAVLEQTHEFRGLYHVIGGVISPIDGIGPEDLRIGSLMSRLEPEGIEEVILATNPTVEGDTTALYVSKMLEKRSIKVTRLALGLPVGGDLEYADRLTIARSLRHRTAL